VNGKRYEIFRIFGIPIRIDLTWIIILLLVTYSLAAGYFPANHKGLPETAYWAMGFVAAIGLFLSILFHELSHAMMARHFNIKIDGITLFIFGGVAEMTEESPSPKVEFLVAVLGPVASVLLAILFYYLSGWVGDMDGNRGLILIFFYLDIMNGLLAGFNLVPAFPLDGGRIFRSILWAIKKDYVWATRVSARIGQGFGWLLVAWGAWNILQQNPMSGFWYILIGFFLKRASQMSLNQVVFQDKLQGFPVSQVMDKEFVRLDPRDRLIDVVSELEHTTIYSHYPVWDSGKLIGALPILKLNQLKGSGWEFRQVGDLLDTDYSEVAVDFKMNAWAAFQKMRQGKVSSLFVMEGGRMSGLLTMERLMGLIARQVT